MNNVVTSITVPDQPHHLTCVARELLPVFSQPEVVAIVFDCWRQLRQQCGLLLHGYVIMEEHLHFLARAERLDICLERFREQTGERILRYLAEQRLERFLRRLPIGEYRGRKGWKRFWQEPEAELIRGEGMMATTLDYIHINPVKRGYVDSAGQWRYSSARNYAGQGGLIEIDRWEEEPVA